FSRDWSSDVCSSDLFTGILNVADTPDALAAVLGHEIAHLTENHVMERARRQSGSSLVGILGGAATGMHDVSHAASTIFLTLPFRDRKSTRLNSSHVK